MEIHSFDDDPIAIDSIFQLLNSRYTQLYRFVMRYNKYIHSSHRYGDVEPLTMIEVHTLTYIEDNPGITPSDLVRYWELTKGAISQILSRLCDRGFITKEKAPDNAKTVLLYATDEGRRISLAHKLYDIKDISKTMSHLQKKLTPEEIDIFYKVIGVYNDVIAADFELNSGHRSDQR